MFKHKLLTFLLFLNLFLAKDIFANVPMSVKMWDGLASQDVKIIKDVAILVANKKFDRAIKRAVDIKNYNKHLHQSLENIILWKKYSNIDLDQNIAFSDISRFVLDNDYFPNIKELKDNVEKLLLENEVPISAYESYFLLNKPRNKETKIKILEDKIEFIKNSSSNFLKAESELDKVQSLISDIWINNNFDEKEEFEFLQKYNGQLTELDHIARINRLLWDNNFTEAQNIINLVSQDYQKLFEAIIKIHKKPRYINNIILSVPRRLRGSEHLQYRRAIYYHLKEDEEKIISLLSSIPANTKHAQKWWKLRHLYGRELLKAKKYQQAYDIISNHGLDSNSYEFSESEWLSGWIALRFLNNPRKAVGHFQNMYDNVSYPISVSRAAYWLGMSYEAMDNIKVAMSWYKNATNYPTYFYGQIAIHKYRSLNNQITLPNFALPQEPVILDDDAKLISYNQSLRVAYVLILMNDKTTALNIIKDVILDLTSKGKIAAIVKLVEEIGDEEMSHKIYRFANRKNVFFIEKQFKVIDKIKDEKHASLIHALIKQESGFARAALSSAGAVGFMQIMPDTAKQIASRLNMTYSTHKLTHDIKYNIKIGSYYIDSLLKRFDDSKVMAIASYNAGPNRVNKWVEEFYDPRKYSNGTDHDNEDLNMVVDWVELLTYGETRNYVQRVMENILVYDYLMANNK